MCDLESDGVCANPKYREFILRQIVISSSADTGVEHRWCADRVTGLAPTICTENFTSYHCLRLSYGVLIGIVASITGTEKFIHIILFGSATVT